jgi:SAM-dependent methyltransferase
MPFTRSRYDGYAEWYDGWNQPAAERNAPDVLDLLGPGEGLCLDLGCGSGHYFDALASTGRTVIGLDRSGVGGGRTGTGPRRGPGLLRLHHLGTGHRTRSRAWRAPSPHSPGNPRP